MNSAVIKTVRGKVLFDEDQSTTCVVMEYQGGEKYVIVPCRARYKIKQVYTEQDLFRTRKIFIV